MGTEDAGVHTDTQVQPKSKTRFLCTGGHHKASCRHCCLGLKHSHIQLFPNVLLTGLKAHLDELVAVLSLDTVKFPTL